MTESTPKKPRKHVRTSDIRGVAQLATQATTSVTNIVEGVHQSVWNTLGVSGKAPGKTGGLTGLVYKSVRGITQLVGVSMDALLARLPQALASTDEAPAGSRKREAVLAALNGVMGDHLVASHSPFATPMTLRYQNNALNFDALPPMPQATGKVLVLIHGLCMNDLQWKTVRVDTINDKKPQGFDHGTVLASTLDYTPVYLRYNSGLHTSQNAHELSALLEQLVAHWPVPIEELTVVAHSMGGLLIRSAFHEASQGNLHWPNHLKNIVFLGTPHHGAPLERAGNWVDVILGSTPYTKPFAKLGHLRSAGITDLRWGNLLHSDWKGRNRFHRKPDDRQHVPLPEGVACYAVAATLAPLRGALADRLIGDGLVPLRSALGQHDEPQRQLVFAKDAQCIIYRTNHMELLSSPAVTQHLLEWLTPRPA